MNAKLRDAIRAAVTAYPPEFHHEGDFTVCLLRGPGGAAVAVGVAKRNPAEDPDIPERGREIALARAVKRLNGNGAHKQS